MPFAINTAQASRHGGCGFTPTASSTCKVHVGDNCYNCYNRGSYCHCIDVSVFAKIICFIYIGHACVFQAGALVLYASQVRFYVSVRMHVYTQTYLRSFLERISFFVVCLLFLVFCVAVFCRCLACLGFVTACLMFSIACLMFSEGVAGSLRSHVRPISRVAVLKLEKRSAMNGMTARKENGARVARGESQF